MKLKLSLIILLYFIEGVVSAQTQDSLIVENSHTESVPIPIEAFAGNKAFTFQLLVTKQFSPESRFGFFNVTTFGGDYEEKNQSSEFYSQSMVTVQVWQSFSIAAGLSTFGSSNGTALTVRPTAGLQYLFANNDFVIVIVPRIDLTQTYNFETFAVLEYHPRLSKKWGIYTRLQGLYNYNTKWGFHEISSIYLRAGVSYHNIQFGLGSNHDFYGPDLNTVNNYGLFIRTELF
ncbi:hypothetical protein [Flavobacterium rivuli]|uniref:hypothetical protein n=1 Tax=Flavobacterium rivuli TaxID=498301 RepID=UPI00035D3F36|nr:hypothetical protein [Flavobacterium rivuli]